MRRRRTVEPERREEYVAITPAEDEGPEEYPRSTFLSVATLGLGALIGGLITLPVLGFAVLPSFTNTSRASEVELGPIDDFPEGEFVIATFLEDPEVGEVTRRTMYIRNNGRNNDDVPSFTMLYSRCAHLGCPVQPNGLIVEDEQKTIGPQNDPADPRARHRLRLPVSRRPVRHRGQPGRRPAGAGARPLRVLDHQRQPRRRRVLQRRQGRGRRRERADLQVRPPGAGRPRRRAVGLALPDRGAAIATAPTRGEQLKHVALYPLDWLEERSGLVGAIKYFLFRKVPRDTNWFHTLGSATLTAFLVQAITGVVLAMYYKPDPDSAYQSIQFITNDLTLGWLVRGMHKWGASVFIILMFLHMARVFLFGAYKYPRELNWIIGVLLLAMGMLEGFTGYLLPVGPDRLLGDRRRDQPERDGAGARARSWRSSSPAAPRSAPTR